MSTLNAARPQEIGGLVADFTADRITGGALSLSTSMAGKKGAVVLFWSGVCSHCVRYDEYLNGFTSRHPDLALLGIASRQQETVEEIRKTIAARRLTFPILRDPGTKLAKLWFAQQTPRAYLVDPGLTLRYRGAIDNFKFPDDPEYIAYLEPAVDDMLSGQPVRQAETASFGCAIESVYYILPKIL
jgi:peroxiredoxin